jgi:hypothetical protein
MKCREAQEKLNKLAGNLLTAEEKQALNEHLDQCPDCARLVLAEQLLTDDIDRIRSTQPLRPMTVDQVRKAIAVREERYQKTGLGARIMRQLSNTINTRPRLSLAMAAACVLLIASVLVPFEGSRPVGYQVAFAAPGQDLVLNRENAERMLASLRLDDARIAVEQTDSEPEYVIAPLRDTAQVNRLTAALDSLGCKRVRTDITSRKPEKRTIWQVIFSDDTRTSAGSPDERLHPKSGPTIVNDLKEELGDNFVLWLPAGDQRGEDLSGILVEKQGEKSSIWLMGDDGKISSDDCGWHQFLNNAIMNTETPDGKPATFKLYEIEDVRKLEKMGYNFATMEWGTPQQIPIPGLGPRLDEVTFDVSTRETVIEYMIPQAYEVSIVILDEDLSEIRVLLDCMPLAGIYQVGWDGLDADGNPVGPGSYFCQFTAGDYVEIREVILEP